MIERRALLAMAAVVDIAIHARGQPVAAGALAGRHGLPPRNFETILRDLARARIIKGTRGPRGGYELARERRRISLGDVVRAVEKADDDRPTEARARLIATAIVPAVEHAMQAALRVLDATTLEELLQRVDAASSALPAADAGGFVI